MTKILIDIPDYPVKVGPVQEGVGPVVFIGQGEEAVVQAVAADVGVEVNFVVAYDGAGEAKVLLTM